MNTDEWNPWAAGAIIVSCVAVIIIATFLVTYRTSEMVKVQSRVWVYDVDLKYDETTISCTTSTSTDSKGRTTSKTSCSPQTSTYTRCTDRLTGDKLPPVRPSLQCNAWPGDYRVDSIYGLIDYFRRGSETREQHLFPLDKWDSLTPGNAITTTLDIWGNVR